MRKRILLFASMMALVVSSCGGGTVESAGADSDALGTGIGVHGAWAVTVFDSQGEKVERRDFTNDLLSSGEEALIHALVVPDSQHPSWMIELREQPSSEDAGIVCPPGQLDFQGICFPTCGPIPPVIHGEDLSVSNAGTHIRLRGSAVVNESHLNNPGPSGACSGEEPSLSVPVIGVSTELGFGSFWRNFTSTPIEPIELFVGQTVQVEVEISFDTLTGAP